MVSFSRLNHLRNKMAAAASRDVSAAQDGQGNIKLHPYLVTLVRWCVSCLWSTATVLLHRLMTAPLQPITGPRQQVKSKAQRTASTEHLHPEPRVECQLLHQPEDHELDVIFVHGLYGSLCNTWRQGDWTSKYQTTPTKVTLRNHSDTTCKCNNDNKCTPDDIYITDLNQPEMTLNKINEKLFKKIIPKENDLITEQFYNNTLLDQVNVLDKYETQAKFVQDLFRRENCDIKPDNDNKCNVNVNECKCNYEINDNECKCSEKKCEVGCGCTCDVCYSTCWPKDWIKVDYPGARVISINYTSDPYLWRPLWIKENKRLSLSVRAHQMMNQLLEMGVGEKPIVWVGHSKGGLFIKEMYCEAYSAYQKLNKTETVPEPNTINDSYQRTNSTNNDAVIAETIDNIVGNMFDNKIQDNNMTFNDYKEKTLGITKTNEYNNMKNMNVILDDNENKCNLTEINESSSMNVDAVSLRIEEEQLSRRARIFSRSAGFMFYSVPHRGSHLADIKTPVTARSLELLEICKDCPLLLDLQRRWLVASQSRARRPAVRGAVETGRTLMSVLWLRIVSVNSADAGIGTLLGVSVDHREICKPSSRHCLLYTELTGLIHEALNPCKC